MLKKNMYIPLEIEAISHDGNGIGRHDGMAVFVPKTAIGDRIRTKVVKVHSRHAFAIMDELLEASPQREENKCPVYSRCGGCSLRHIGYEHEVTVKSAGVAENLARIGGVQIAMEPPAPSSREARYRNKAQYPVRSVNGEICTGFFAPRSHTLIPVRDCLLQPAFFADITDTVIDFLREFAIEPYEEETHSGLVRHIYIRYAEETGQVMLCLILNGKELPHSHEFIERMRTACAKITTIVLNSNCARTNVIFGESSKTLYGPGYIVDILCGIRVEISAQSFYQVNRAAAQELYRQALAWIKPGAQDILLDLYCGTGTIGLSMANAVGQVIGVEVVPQAVDDARRNAQQNEITNARFLCADASGAVQVLQEEGIKPDIIVLDPPRKGVDEQVLESIGAFAPRKLLYISCNSATLARDCKVLQSMGYMVQRARAFDFFPRTAHVETVCSLYKE